MAATHSRHHGNYARPAKTLPITMPVKTSTTYKNPVSRVAMSPPELDETSTVYSKSSKGSKRSGGTFSDVSDDYESRYPAAGIDVMEELSDRMNNVFDRTKMDRSIVKQAQTSGELNAKQRELAELQALAQRRVRSTRVKFDQFEDRANEARDDLAYTRKTVAAMKANAVKTNPEAYEEARRSRQSRR